MLKVSFEGYFSAGELNISEQWIINPFIFHIDQMTDDDDLKEDLIDLKENQAMKLQFDANDFDNFWCCYSSLPEVGYKSPINPRSICYNVLV